VSKQRLNHSNIDLALEQMSRKRVPQDVRGNALVDSRQSSGLFQIAKQAGFTQKTFDNALANQQVADGIQWVARRALEKFCVGGTPTFFINGTIHRGEMSVDALDRFLQRLLNA
jgi:2-hydroxychromene-2-carboxylate isomerase